VIRVYPFLPGKFVDVVTFEVKLADAADVSCVYEALAHRRSATTAYVIIVGQPDDDASGLIRQEAVRHGIGLLSVEPNEIGDPDKWDLQVHAVRNDTDPEALNSFLSHQLDQNEKDDLQTWLR
jgi:hypothetical protein